MSEFSGSIITGPILQPHPGEHSKIDKRVDLRVEFIDDSTRLHALQPRWRQLWLSLSETTLFQSPAWIVPWWHHYGEGRMFSFAFWSKEELVGLAPLYIYSSGGSRRLFLIGTGNSDYLDVSFRSEFREHCWRALISGIAKRSGSWDECNFQRLRRGSPLLADLTRDCGLAKACAHQEPCSALHLVEDNSAASLLKNADYYTRKLARAHAFSIERTTAESLDEFLLALQRLHQLRWHDKGLPGVMRDRDCDFHREAARRFLEHDNLRVYGLRIRGNLAAVGYGFHHRDQSYYYLTGFDPAYGHMSLGTILLGVAVRRSMQEGAKGFDFLRGNEAYKQRWGAHQEPIFAVTLVQPRSDPSLKSSLG